MITLSNTQKQQLLTSPVRRLLDVVRENGEARIVGGAVRDILLGRTLGDIDFATTLVPDQLITMLSRHRIRTVPTGLAHGTITAVIEHVGYEITTLRRDIATDGRHATVVFTDDWQADAARRDFTFNALYVDGDGVVYDYFDGVKDAKEGHVRFIGNPDDRIQEDVLRILRFFRFYAWFGQGAADRAALSACQKLSHLIPSLSAERVAREMLKLLASPDPLPAWGLMQDAGILPFIAPEASQREGLKTLLSHEKEQGQTTAALTRLASLLSDENAASALAARLKFSTNDHQRLRLLTVIPGLIDDRRAFGDTDAPASFRRLIYAYGVEAMREAIFLNGHKISERLALLAAWENPVLPIRGEDLMKRGIPAGPRLGEILRDIEKSWIADDFKPTREDCLRRLEAYLHSQ